MITKKLAYANYVFAYKLAQTNSKQIPYRKNYRRQENTMNLTNAQLGEEYIIRSIETHDEELDAFLFSLGCYSGEPITVVSRQRRSCVVSIKDGRYSIDRQLAEAIRI